MLSKVKRDWFKWCADLLCRFGVASELHCSGLEANDKITDIASSFGSCVILASIVELGRKKMVEDFCFGVLEQSLRRALLMAPDGAVVLLGDTLFLQIIGNGRVIGLQDLLRSLPRACETVLRKFWDDAKADGKLQDPLDYPSHFLPDVLFVLAYILRRRREANKKPLSQSTVSQILQMRLSLLHWAAYWIDRYIIASYCSAHDVDSPPPALKVGVRHKVHPEAIWALMQEILLYNQSAVVLGGSVGAFSLKGALIAGPSRRREGRASV